MNFSPNYRDLQFVLHEVLDVTGEFSKTEEFQGVDRDTVDLVMAQAGRFAETVIYPINKNGDQGCSYDPETHSVTTPPGFQEAYKRYCDDGWPALGASAVHEGQGLPATINHVLFEFLFCASSAWSMYPMASQGVYQLLKEHGTEQQKALYLPHVAAGTWSGTMCLTEPQAGTDLGLIKTKAEPVGDGRYELSGAKIFTSGGEHDLNENILHLVLARLPDAPEGVKGLSLFLVPKFHVDATGELGERNPVYCSAIEKKMGIRGSATCQMSFEGAVGELIGEPNRGLNAMFVMINRARVAVALQGLGVEEASYQMARSYARERIQSKPLAAMASPTAEAVPIIEHPDVRRMLMTIKAQVEGGRALVYWVSLLLDLQEAHPDEKVRKESGALVSLLTPIMKSLLTDNGFNGANLALQVHGGHGFISDVGIEQYVRDARIFQIYEGTNSVQALDLLGRKVLLGGGEGLRILQSHVAEFLEQSEGDAAMNEFAEPLSRVATILQDLTAKIGGKAMGDPSEVGSASVDYLAVAAHLVQSLLWARMAQAALKGAADGDEFYSTKLATARFYFEKLAPEIESCLARIDAGSKTLMAVPAEAF